VFWCISCPPSSKKTRGKKRTTLPYVKRHGSGVRGWYMENGRQRRGPTFPTEEQAHRWAVEMRENAERHALGQLTLGDGMDLVRKSIDRKRRRDGTLQWYEGQFRVLGRAWDLAMPLSKLDRRQVQWFIERREQHTNPRTGEPVTGSTIRAHLRALGRIFNLAIREGFLAKDANPVQQVELPEVEDPIPYQPVRETVEGVLQRMRDAGGHEDADVVQLLFTTGLRRTELAHVRVEDVDFEARVLRVEHGKRGKRDLPIPAAMVPLLERLIALGEPDESMDEEPIGRRQWTGEGPKRYLLPGPSEGNRAAHVGRIFTRWKWKLGLQEFKAHAMRHAFTTYLDRLGFPESVIGRLAGHKPSVRSMTQHYINPHVPRLRAAMACFWEPIPEDEYAEPSDGDRATG